MLATSAQLLGCGERLLDGPDELAVQPVRFFVTELIRETIFEEYEEEVPYASVAAIDEYRENTDPIFIRATIYVERESQKGILVGKGGAGIKRLGERSREKIEAFVGGHVYLDLKVKALPNWRKKGRDLRRFGYTGDVHLVSRSQEEIDGIRCVKAVRELPRDIDATLRVTLSDGELAGTRNPIYAQAHIHIRSQPMPHEKAVQRIVEALSGWKAS